MKLTYLGIVRRHGEKKNGTGTFDFTTLLAAKPVEASSRGKYNQNGYGMEVEEFNATRECVQDFAQVKPMSVVDVAFTPDPQNPRRNVVTGLL